VEGFFLRSRLIEQLGEGFSKPRKAEMTSQRPRNGLKKSAGCESLKGKQMKRRENNRQTTKRKKDTRKKSKHESYEEGLSGKGGAIIRSHTLVERQDLGGFKNAPPSNRRGGKKGEKGGEPLQNCIHGGRIERLTPIGPV